ncbi:MAG: D-aminoacyl-tRNA deacylase [Bacteroidota bacterium]|jgi:D-tyrosyl-tRNA(Tyr) deacylase
MKCIIQRVQYASIVVDEVEIASIKHGILAFIGYSVQDTPKVNTWLAEKLIGYRIFSDSSGKMNLSVKDINGEILIVSNFTLCAQTSKGLRPGFTDAKLPKEASQLFTELYHVLSQYDIPVSTGQFGADMKISLLNDGPVTFILEQ